jgi:hypothetical protein
MLTSALNFSVAFFAAAFSSFAALVNSLRSTDGEFRILRHSLNLSDSAMVACFSSCHAFYSFPKNALH